MSITKDLEGWNSWSSGPLRSGPMLGEVGETDARVWAQARDTSPLTLTVFLPNNKKIVVTANPKKANGLCVIFHVKGLSPGSTHDYMIENSHSHTATYRLRSGLPREARKARIAFGSCYRDYEDNGLEIFESIKNDNPDLFLMTGDNCYFGSNEEHPEKSDWANEDNMMLAQLRNRNNTALRKVLPRISVLGIWDDHDFGPNNSDSTFSGKNNALSVFKLMWAQRSYGAASADGVFSTVRCGPIEVFLTDGRFHRVEKNHILGSSQLEWLKSQLLGSTAPVKLVVSGSVVLPRFVETIENGNWDGWRQDASAELDALLAHIEAHDIKGVVFASGDLHLGYVMRRPGTSLSDGKRGPDLWEVISSPLANSTWQGEHVLDSPTPTYDPYLVTEVVSRNYGFIDVDLDRAGGEVCLSLKNEHGAICIDKLIPLASLKVRKAVSKMSAVVWPNGSAYFFEGDHYVRYSMDPNHEGVDSGYPRPIKGNWKGLKEAFPNGIDAAAVWPTGKAYFFKGNGYVRYTMDPAHEGVDEGYPKYISLNWKGLWSSDIDACTAWSNGKAYFFKGSEYIRVDLATKEADPGYPKPIAENWKGLWPGDIDAAVAWNNGKAYFFKGSEYIRVDLGTKDADPGYPKPIHGNWPGLETL